MNTGLEISPTRGILVFRCAYCAREQKEIPIEIVESIGWVRIENKYWLCPFCAHNEEKLFAAFVEIE